MVLAKFNETTIELNLSCDICTKDITETLTLYFHEESDQNLCAVCLDVTEREG